MQMRSNPKTQRYDLVCMENAKKELKVKMSHAKCHNHAAPWIRSVICLPKMPPNSNVVNQLLYSIFISQL
jgi:hypothetical protein